MWEVLDGYDGGDVLGVVESCDGMRVDVGVCCVVWGVDGLMMFLKVLWRVSLLLFVGVMIEDIRLKWLSEVDEFGVSRVWVERGVSSGMEMRMFRVKSMW